jgi:hypothetical protein
MKREKTQISKIRNKKGKKIANMKEIQGIIRDYFENQYSNKLENLEKTDKFLGIFYSFIHMCIHCLGRFSPLSPAPSFSPQHSLASRHNLSCLYL